MVVKQVVMPIKASRPLEEWRDMFPSRHGRVSFEEFKNSAPYSAPMVRFLGSLHFEFGEFHKRLLEPLAADTGVEELVEYSFNLVERMHMAKQSLETLELDLETVVQASMITDLVKICLVENDCGLVTGRFPRWVFTHCSSVPAETLVQEAQAIIRSEGALFRADEGKFWTIIKRLALLDLSPLVANLLRAYIENHHVGRKRGSVEMLASFFADVPSLYEIAASACTEEEALGKLEKRRQLASAGLHKASVSGAELKDTAIDFIWRLQTCLEEDRDMLLGEINELFADDPWYIKVMLAWTWLYPLNTPEPEIVRSLALQVPVTTDTNASVIDAALHAVLSGDLVALFTVLVQEHDPWLPAIVADVCFYAGYLPLEIRDSLLLAYCHWLSASGQLPKGLGTRMAADVVITLSPKASGRAGLEIFGRLANSDSILSRNKQWMSTVRLCPSDEPWAESICLEKFHTDTSIIDAVHTLAVAAEVGSDINVGACRISDYLDAHVDEAKEGFQRSGPVVVSSLLPEYIESGRLGFLAEWALPSKSVQDLVQMATSPNCPPEKIIVIVGEIRNKGERLSVDQVVALCKVLSDLDTWIPSGSHKGPVVDLLLSWLSTQLVL
jgi:hypothetical protein